MLGVGTSTETPTTNSSLNDASFKELKKVFENMIEENPDFEYLDLNIAVTADVQEETLTSPTQEVT